MSIVVIGVGNRLRGDDAAGPAVADRVRAQAPGNVDVRICEQEPSRLLDALAGADVAFVVDAVSTGAAPGTLHRFDASTAPVPSRELRSSTHALGVGESLELARALGRLPRRTVVFGIEGRAFLAGGELSRAVEESVERAAASVLEEVAQCTNEP
ncbi:MAG TPA: hydrogenase maturation protease [Gaiellaceae bacterium]|nr:hydrogenase maturation protease [Gaiellaceae bacterium]